MISDEQMRAAFAEAEAAAYKAELLARVYNGLLAQAMIERDVKPGFTIDPSDGSVKPLPRKV